MQKIIATGLLLCATGVVAAPNIKEGLWEISTQVEMPEAPVQMPKMTRTECMSNDKLIPDQQDQQDLNELQQKNDCKMTDNLVNGDTVSWITTCKTEDSLMTAKGEITYKSESYEGTIDTQVSSPEGEPVNMKTKMTGRYIGPCEKN